MYDVRGYNFNTRFTPSSTHALPWSTTAIIEVTGARCLRVKLRELQATSNGGDRSTYSDNQLVRNAMCSSSLAASLPSSLSSSYSSGKRSRKCLAHMAKLGFFFLLLRFSTIRMASSASTSLGAGPR